MDRSGRLADRVLGQLGWERRSAPSDGLARHRGASFGRSAALPASAGLPAEPGPLESYFDSHTEGPGLWKWRHYFPMYERHLGKLVGCPVDVVEVGVFSGGSLGMWRSYFGSGATIHGVDIEPACRAYEAPGVRISIGDQADPAFWRRFCADVPEVDVVIDDGGHEPAQQIATLEALLPRLRAGGVYICEDILTEANEFHEYLHGLTLNLHAVGVPVPDGFAASGFQQAVDSVHVYPYAVVIEMRAAPVDRLVAPKHGTHWEPFYEADHVPGGAPEL